MPSYFGFNTASGRYYCNLFAEALEMLIESGNVSIPQAVGTIAMILKQKIYILLLKDSFNTASGRYYCNSRPYKASIHGD